MCLYLEANNELNSGSAKAISGASLYIYITNIKFYIHHKHKVLDQNLKLNEPKIKIRQLNKRKLQLYVYRVMMLFTTMHLHVLPLSTDNQHGYQIRLLPFSSSSMLT